MINHAFTDPAILVQQYVDDVLSGVVRIGHYERAAVDRYLDDLEHGAGRGLYFSRKLATRACNFFPLILRHTAGEWNGEPFVLQPWQAFFVWNIWGWRWAESKLRRFRKALLYIARKNGKTQLGAGIADMVLGWDYPNEPDGQIYATATKEEQAALLWKAGLKMLDGSPELVEHCHILGRKNKKGGQITMEAGPNRGTTFSVLGADGKTQDGLSPSVVLKDEYHEWREHHRDLDDKLSTGGGARRQPLEIILTTAGTYDSEILLEELSFCQKVVDAGARGEPADDSVFAMIFQLDDEDDDLDPDNWRKANPGLGITPKLEYLQAQALEATLKPSKRNSWKRYHCNLTTAAFAQAYPAEHWDRGDQTFGEPEPGAMAFAAVDKAAVNDWCAVSLVFPMQDEATGVWRYLVRAKFWACEGKGVIDYTLQPFAGWISSGLLEYQTGEIIDPAPIKLFIREMFSLYTIQAFAFDKMFCYEMAADLLNNDGVPMVEFIQTYNRYEPPIEAFDSALTEGRIAHEGAPVLAWHAGNAEYTEDHRGRRMFKKGGRGQKGSDRKKIDGVVAMIMAFEQAITFGNVNQDDDVLIK